MRIGINAGTDRYLHWDDLYRRPAPEGLSWEEAWAGLTLHRRSDAQDIPLLAKTGKPLWFNMTNRIAKELRRIDLQAGGNLAMPETAAPAIGKEAQEIYLIKSLLEESFTSSRLEGAATTRAVARRLIEEGRQPRDRHERMVLNNYAAMEFVRDRRQEKLSPDFILDVHRIVTDGTLDDPEMAGRLRRSDQMVMVYDSYNEILHDPPPAEELPKRIQALCDFANRDFSAMEEKAFIHPVVQAIVLHFMLAYDHPFIDGNGRTARALFYWLMLKSGYWLMEYVSISGILLKSSAQYGRAFLLAETDDLNVTYFIDHQLDVLWKAILALKDHIAKLDKDSQTFRADLLRSPRFADLNKRQVNFLVDAHEKPGSRWTIESYRRRFEISYMTARNDLVALQRMKLVLRLGRKDAQFFIPDDIQERLLHPEHFAGDGSPRKKSLRRAWPEQPAKPKTRS